MPLLDLSCLQLAPAYLQTLQALLAQYVPEAEVWAYGSRVNGGAHEGSDLDLVLRHSSDLTLGVNGCLELKEALQKSHLPLLVDVHVWAHLPVRFQENIEASGYVMVQEAQ